MAARSPGDAHAGTAVARGKVVIPAPVIEYEWKGKLRSHESHTYSSPPDYKVGEAVSLFVNREDTGDVIIDTFADRYALIVGLGFIGGVLCLISIVFLYFGRRKF